MNQRWLSSFMAMVIMSIHPLYGHNITVIGIGKLGLCVALSLENAGNNVLGIDINESYVKSLNDKTFTSLEPEVNNLLQQSTRFRASCSLDEGLAFSDLYYITVDTTAGKEAYDHKNLSALLSDINKRKVANKHIVIGCTVFPGYIRTTGKALIQDCINTTLSYHPQFIAQGNIIHGLKYPDILLIGSESKAAEEAIELLSTNVCYNNPYACRMSPESAEITKLAINCFITTKIAYANMIADIADQTPGADKFLILDAIGADKRIGHLCLRPGYGFGGPCFPRDNRALGSYAEIIGIDPFIPRATDAANKLHATYMTNQLLNQNKECYNFKKVAYKDDCKVPIIEESQKLVIAASLAKAGRKVVIIDTEPVISEVQKAFGDIFEYTIVT
jgi:UDPglucose 6-dehydrogenase